MTTEDMDFTAVDDENVRLAEERMKKVMSAHAAGTLAYRIPDQTRLEKCFMCGHRTFCVVTLDYGRVVVDFACLNCHGVGIRYPDGKPAIFADESVTDNLIAKWNKQMVIAHEKYGSVYPNKDNPHATE